MSKTATLTMVLGNPADPCPLGAVLPLAPIHGHLGLALVALEGLGAFPKDKALPELVVGHRRLTITVDADLRPLGGEEVSRTTCGQFMLAVLQVTQKTQM